MKLICPSCGATASAESWQNDDEVREAVRLIVSLPTGVASRALEYLALFRASKTRGLGWSRARRLITEIKWCTEGDYIQWGMNPARKNDVRYWAEGIRKIVDHPPRELPLKTHGYLIRVVYGLAEAAAKEAEKDQIRMERTQGHRPDDDRSGREPERISPEDMKKITDERFRKRP